MQKLKRNASSALFTATLAVQSLVIGLKQIIHSAESPPSSQYAARSLYNSVCVHFSRWHHRGTQKGIICGCRSVRTHRRCIFSLLWIQLTFYLPRLDSLSARLFTGAGNKYRLHLARGSCLQRRLACWVGGCTGAAERKRPKRMRYCRTWVNWVAKRDRKERRRERVSLQRRPPMQISANLMPGRIKRTRSAHTFWGLQLLFFPIGRKGTLNKRSIGEFFTDVSWFFQDTN